MAKSRLQAIGDDPVGLLRQAVQAIEAQQAKKDAGVIMAMDRWPEVTKEEFERLSLLDTASLRKEGWTKRELQIAKKARLPRAKVPYALQAAQERNLARIRRLEEAAGGAKLNLTINVPARAERRDIQDVVVIEATEVKG